jgi:hypothetical protein
MPTGHRFVHGAEFLLVAPPCGTSSLISVGRRDRLGSPKRIASSAAPSSTRASRGADRAIVLVRHAGLTERDPRPALRARDEERRTRVTPWPVARHIWTIFLSLTSARFLPSMRRASRGSPCGSATDKRRTSGCLPGLRSRDELLSTGSARIGGLRLARSVRNATTKQHVAPRSFGGPLFLVHRYNVWA